MADLEKLKHSLEERGFAVSCFDTAEEAADYLDAALDGKTIGIGGHHPGNGPGGAAGET